MQEPARPKMIQRRLIYHAARAVLFLLGVLLVWKMVWIATTLGDVSNIADGDEKLGAKSNPVLVEVYYESMCPDSKYFIREQLVPTVKKIPEIINFRLIPYGKATTFENSTGIYFFCQHEENECQGNKIHSCAIKYISSPTKLLNYVSCLIKNIRYPQGSAKSCADIAEVEWDPIDECANSREGAELLKAYGEETSSLNPRVSFIPTVVINHSQGVQKDILKNLLKEVCKAYTDELPGGCTS